MSSTADEDDIPADAVVDFISLQGYNMDKSPEADKQAETMFGIDGIYYRINQYVQNVLDFSSQYGSDYSISYNAPNVIGRPSKYPDAGDFPETFAMRTYGNWWERAPSSVAEIQPQNIPKLPSQDYIVVHFEDYIIPEEIAIFETFNPGAVVRIWAYTIQKSWICLWEATTLNTHPPPAYKARRFSPPIKRIQMPTRIIRLEFNHSHLNYFTEIDAVLLCGRHVNLRKFQCKHKSSALQEKGSIVRKLQSIQFRPNFKENYENTLQDFLMNDLEKFITVISPMNELQKKSDYETLQTKTGLNDMPFEIMLNIFSHLDLASLFRVGQVSRFFYDVSTHPLLYSELNLKHYWRFASSELLCTLAKRATILRKLDLSWCGLFYSISPTEFKKFIQHRGDNLTHLRLNSCKFLNSTCIELVGIVCDNLKELSLRNCSFEMPSQNFSCLANLKNLERLDLSQSVIESELLLIMLENNRKLKHLNLAFSGVTINMDDVAQHIATYNQQLVSLDMWKSHFLSASGLLALSNCHELEEVDFGWCLREASLGDSLTKLLTNCTKLKKLFLATVRGMTDRDVENIANLCINLEQLDLMGVLGISKGRYYEVLTKCKKLQLLDLNFCDSVLEHDIEIWSQTFPVKIKYSHVPLEVRY